MTNKTHVYINEEFAKQIQAADNDPLLQQKVIEDIIKRKQLEVEAEMSILDEQVLQFKLVSSRFERSLSEAYEQQDEKLQKLIDTVSGQYDKVRETSTKLSSNLYPLKNEVNSMVETLEKFDRRLTDINTYRIEKFLDILERISQLDDKTQIILAGLLSEN